MKTVLLTGGTGYLGSKLLGPILSRGNKVVFLKRSFSNTERVANLLPQTIIYDIDKVSLSQIFKEQKIDIILHCATDYGRKDVNPMRLIEANLALPLTLLQLAEQHGVSTFINTDTILDKRVSSYSLSKRQFFEWLQFFSSKLICISVAIEHFYGPGDDPSKFVIMIVDKILTQSPHVALTPGEQKRDFIFIDDVVDGFVRLVEAANEMKPGLHKFEIGSGKTISIKEFVKLITALANNSQTELRFGALPYRENEVMETKVDLSAMFSIGWRPMVSLEEGLKRTIELERMRLG